MRIPRLRMRANKFKASPNQHTRPAFRRHLGSLSGFTRRRRSATKRNFSQWEQLMGPDSTIAKPEDKGRWKYVVPAFATHMCIGSPWAWSELTRPLNCEYGFVVPAADDWSFSQCTYPLSIVFALQGISAAFAAKWQLKVGARTAMATAGGCFGGGLMLGGLGIYTHSLPLVYIGYGLLGGTGVGVAYTPPVQALIQWFPDKKGLASGLCIAGFGSGALLFSPAIKHLMTKFSELPTYVGNKENVSTTMKDGRLFANIGGDTKEVVYANSTDLAKLPYDLAEGYYVVGSGCTGAAQALTCMGGVYLATMLTSAFTIKKPHKSYVPEGYVAETTSDGVAKNVNVDAVMKTPQFYCMLSLFFCVATGGIGLFSVAKPMIAEVFAGSLPNIVTASFASSFLLLLAGANLGGRLGWSMVSDIVGRKPVFYLFTLGSIPLYLAIPSLVKQVVATGSPAPLYMFCGTTFVAVTFMGGVYAGLPAYEADLFGSKYVGAIHGRVLLASAGAAIAGPSILVSLRNKSELEAISGLMTNVDPQKFLDTFKVPVDNFEDLIATKTLTISKLMEIMPAGIQDPTPFIYDSTMYTMAGFMAVAACSQAAITKVNPKFFEKVD